MTSRIESLLEQVRALSREEQVQLLAEQHDIVSPPDPEWEAAWAAECERRLGELDRGEVEAEDFDVVMAKARARLKRV